MSADPVERLPQTGPARLVVEAVEVEEERTVCLARVPRASGLRSLAPAPGLLPLSVVIEIAAQAAATAEPAQAEGATGSGPRLLVGVRGVRFLVDSLDANATFRVVTTRTTHAPPFRSYAFELFHDDQPVASGELSTFFDSEGTGAD